MQYIDNQGALYSFINGRSVDCDINRIVFLAGFLSARLNLRVWYDYVSSGSNIADLPTRLTASAMDLLDRIGTRMPMGLPSEEYLLCSWRVLLPMMLSAGF